MKICIPLKQLWGYCGERRPWGQAGRQVNRLVESVRTRRGLVTGQQCVSFPLKCVSSDQRPRWCPRGRGSFRPWVGGTFGFLGFCPGVSCPWVCDGGGQHSQLCFFILFLVVRFVFVLFSVFPPSCFPGSPGGAADPERRRCLQCTLWGEHRQPGRPGWWWVPRSVSWLRSSYLPWCGRSRPTRPREGLSTHSRQKIPVRPCFPCRHRAKPWLWWSFASVKSLLVSSVHRGFCGGQVWTSFLSPQTLLASELLMLHDALRARWTDWRCEFWEGWRCVCTTSGSVWPEVLFWSVQYVLPSLYVPGSDTRTGGGHVTGGEGWGGRWNMGLRLGIQAPLNP